MASERMTSISLRGLNSYFRGFADWGAVPSAKMIAMFRMQAEALRRDAEAVLAAADEDFRIETYRGVHVKRDRKIIQEGK